LFIELFAFGCGNEGLFKTCSRTFERIARKDPQCRYAADALATLPATERKWNQKGADQRETQRWEPMMHVFLVAQFCFRWKKVRGDGLARPFTPFHLEVPFFHFQLKDFMPAVCIHNGFLSRCSSSFSPQKSYLRQCQISSKIIQVFNQGIKLWDILHCGAVSSSFIRSKLSSLKS
jgi:hypothetical protein